MPIPTSDATPARPQRVETEDVILYVFVAILTVLIGAYFVYVTIQQQRALLDPQLTFDTLTKGDSPEDRYYMTLQAGITLRRYQHAAASTFSNAARANVAFLIGTIMAVVGTLFVVRRVRETPVAADWNGGDVLRFKVALSSPGLFMGFLGTVIIVTAILADDSVIVQDDGISYPALVGTVSDAATTASPSETSTVDVVRRWQTPSP